MSIRSLDEQRQKPRYPTHCSNCAEPMMNGTVYRPRKDQHPEPRPTFCSTICEETYMLRRSAGL